ncbi:unnamed protein product, partial [marine sediment metagenome]
MPAPFRLILLLSLGVFAQTTFAQPGAGPMPVVVAPVVEREVASYRSFVANVNPNRQSTIGSAVDGRVVEFLVNAGQQVTAGQSLALLRTGTIEIEIAGAEAQVALAKAELAELENGFRPEEIELAEAKVEAAIAANRYAQAKLNRTERLFKSGAGVSENEYDEAVAAALGAAASLRGAESSLEMMRQGPR